MIQDNSKIRVLHFIWSANFGGIEKLVIYLVKDQMNDPQIQPHLLIGCKKGELVGKLGEFMIPHTFAGLKSGYDYRSTALKILKNIMKGYDVIHLHTFNPLVAYAALRSGKKIMYTIHGNFNLGRRIRLNDHVMNFLRKQFLNRKGILVTFNSWWSKELAEKRFGLKHNEKMVIYNGFIPENQSGLSSLPARPEPVSDHDFVVGTACRFNEGKRIDRLIEGFARFSEDKNDVMLLLVGDGVMRPNLEQLADRLGVKAKTKFTGYREDVSGFQRMMDVSVIPSQYESFGLAALETMKFGIPTLMFTDAGGMLEIPGDEFRDDVVEDTAGLAKRLEFYYNKKKNGSFDNPAERIKRASKFRFEEMTSSYKNGYLKLINHKND